jgi:uncharacterized protein (TIGR03083 family)
MNTQSHLDHLRADVERIAHVVERGDLLAPIAACPGWDVRELVLHLGKVHRWAEEAARTVGRPMSTSVPPDADRDLAAWIRDGGEQLVTTLQQIPADAPTWHPFPVAMVAGVWARRQAHETSIHRWDVEKATGAAAPIDAELASDGIDEYFELGLPRLVVRETITIPDSSMHVHCTDVAGEWLVWNDGGELRIRREHAKGDAALRGPAEAIQLRLWNRMSDRVDELDIVGDVAVAEQWLSLGGL